MEINEVKMVKVNKDNDLKFRIGLSEDISSIKGTHLSSGNVPDIHNVNEKKNTNNNGELQYITE